MTGAILIMSMICITVVSILVIEKKDHISEKNQFSEKEQFLHNILLSVLSPLIIFIIAFYSALELDKRKPFDWEDTWWVWAIFLLVISLIEKKLFSIRKRSHYFKKNISRFLFYLSSLSTIVASIVYFLMINVQLYSRVGRSTRDGFLLYAFFYCYILPIIFWVVYYVFIKKNDAFNSLLKKKQGKKNKKAKVLKRDQAIKELKEAKELLDLGILSKKEYDDLSKKLKPIILDINP